MEADSGDAGERLDQGHERDQQGETAEDHEKSTDLAGVAEDDETADVLTAGLRRLDSCAVAGGVVGADASNIGEQDQPEAEATQHEQQEYREEDQHGKRVAEAPSLVQTRRRAPVGSVSMTMLMTYAGAGEPGTAMNFGGCGTAFAFEPCTEAAFLWQC